MKYSEVHGTKRQQYERTRVALENERSSFIAHWQDCSRFILPRRSRFQISDRNKGERRNQSIIDGTATLAANTAQSGIHAGTTNPTTEWVWLTVPDPDLAEFPQVKEWLHQVTQNMLSLFLQSNIYQSLPLVYLDMVTFGTPAISMLEHEREVFRTKTYPVGSFSLGIDQDGKVDTFVREYQMSVRQIVGEFLWNQATDTIDWKNASVALQNAWDQGNYETMLDVCWITAPNPDKDARKLGSKYLPWSSCYFEKGQNEEGKFLRESGFEEFPVFAPRWTVGAEEIYATQWPAADALGDIRQLQTMQRRKGQAIEKMVNPPVIAPVSMMNRPVSILPGEVTYGDEGQFGKGVRSIHEVPNFIGELREDVGDIRNIISRHFHENLFLMLAQSDRRQITAREIEERHQEKLLALGPALERINEDLLDPLIDRAFAIMVRRGMVPPPPEEIQGMPLKVVYRGLLAQAQHLTKVVAIDRYLSSVVPLMEFFPRIGFRLNPDQIAEEYRDALGVNPKFLVSKEEADAAQAQAQQAQQMAMQAEIAATGAKAAKDLGSTDMSQDSALSRIAEGVTQ